MINPHMSAADFRDRIRKICLGLPQSAVLGAPRAHPSLVRPTRKPAKKRPTRKRR